MIGRIISAMFLPVTHPPLSEYGEKRCTSMGRRPVYGSTKAIVKDLLQSFKNITPMTYSFRGAVLVVAD